MGIAVFNLAMFLARYPEFTAYSAANPGALASIFLETGLYLNNTPTSPIRNLTVRLVLLNMLTAHVAFLGGALSADGQTRPVGRVSAAGEGSVSASFDYTPATDGGGAWFKQSAYGASFWQATANLRGFRYVPGHPRPLGSIGRFIR
jgi:Protein of unknown function (DUF4054)